jgi:hypothetical protein
MQFSAIAALSLFAKKFSRSAYFQKPTFLDYYQTSVFAPYLTYVSYYQGSIVQLKKYTRNMCFLL